MLSRPEEETEGPLWWARGPDWIIHRGVIQRANLQADQNDARRMTASQSGPQARHNTDAGRNSQQQKQKENPHEHHLPNTFGVERTISLIRPVCLDSHHSFNELTADSEKPWSVNIRTPVHVHVFGGTELADATKAPARVNRLQQSAQSKSVAAVLLSLATEWDMDRGETCHIGRVETGRSRG